MVRPRTVGIGKDFAEKLRQICDAIMNFERESDESITLLIDCHGGLVTAEEVMLRTIKNAKCPVDGLVTKDALSAAFNILQACRKRLAYPGARLMFHAPRIPAAAASVMFPFPAELDVPYEDCEAHAMTLNLIAERSGQPLESLQGWSREERFFSAEEALHLKFIDEIIQG